MKRIFATLLAVMMIFSLTACQKESAPEPAPADPGSEEPAQEEAAEADGPDISEPVELTMVIQTDGVECQDNAMVEEAINKILKEKLNVTLHIKHCGFTDTRTNMNLWLSSGEPCDVFVSWFSWPTYKEYAADLTPYMDIMPHATQALGDFIENGYDNGKLLGLPAIKDWVAYNCYLMRKDLVEETGMEPGRIKTYDQFEELLRKIKENHPDMHPLTNGTATRPSLFFESTNQREDGSLYATDLFDGITAVGLMDPVTSSEVSCLYFSQFYEDLVNMAYRWAEEGLLYDATILNGSEQVAAGTAAGYGTTYKPGIESQENVTCGTEMVSVCMPDVTEGVLKTNTSFNWIVNKKCANVERACMLLDLLYYDAEINNLLCWGVEDVHYVKTDDPNIIEYPEGVDAATVGYYSWGKFEFPNNYLQYVMYPSPSNLWEEMAVFNQAPASKALGFVFDPTPVEGQIAAVQNVVSQYNQGLGSGMLEPAMLEEFRQALKDNGIEDVIKEAQSQLDAFLAGSGN